MSFTTAHFVALLPIITLAAAAIVVMLLVAFVRRRDVSAIATVVGLVATLLTLPIAADVAPLDVTRLLRIDGAALLYTGFLLLCTLGVTGLSAGYLRGRDEAPGELYILLLTAVLGAAVLAASAHFAALFLGFELLSVSLFALLAYSRERKPCLEAGAKYLILSGVSSSFLLFGIALVYAELGTLEFARVADLLAAADGTGLYATAGVALIVAGIAFKLSLVPFHLWTPDVYQGAPAPITAFLATVSKGAIFVVLLRYFLEAGAFDYVPLLVALSLLAGASMLLGNILALLQQNVKRILAYSSIAHLGYLLVAFIAGGEVAVEAASYYLAAYFASTIGAFGIVAVLSSAAGEEMQMLGQYRGLFWRRPWLAGVFSLMLLSLAGIPLTMGFVAKFYVVAASIDASLWVLLALVIIGSGIGLFYYLRVLVTLYLDPEEATLARHEAAVSPSGHVVLAAATLAVLWLGIFPAQLIDFVRATAFSLV
ncbi:MAG TPA: NADH-quinone oxidoreductase subunit N [Gammaproteobacteria bacterium]